MKDTDKELRLRGKLPLAVAPVTSRPKLIGRLIDPDSLCPCQSGLKYKKCCRRFLKK